MGSGTHWTRRAGARGPGCSKRGQAEGGLEGHHISKVARDERVWIRPVSRLWNFADRRTVEKGPRGTQTTSVMGTTIHRDNCFRQADFIASTVHLDRVGWEAWWCGAVVVMKRSDELHTGRDQRRYHLSARTGHHNLSSRTEEWEDKDGRRISMGPEDSDWLLARNPALGIKRTPNGCAEDQ